MIDQGWSFSMRAKIKEASKLRVISAPLKNFCIEILEIGDTKFDLIYSNTRTAYRGVIFRDTIGVKTMAHILKNYGKQVFLAVKTHKRI